MSDRTFNRAYLAVCLFFTFCNLALMAYVAIRF